MLAFRRVEAHVEKLTGLSIELIRQMGPDELRAHLEKKNNQKLKFTSEFPIIGRGNVLRDSLKTTEQLNEEVDLILG